MFFIISIRFITINKVCLLLVDGLLFQIPPTEMDRTQQQIAMSHNEATTPAADWESRSISSLTTVHVSNTTHKVTPASMADNFVPPDPNEVSVSVVLSANSLGGDGGSSLSNSAEAAGPAVGPNNRAAFEDHGMLVREAARARRLDDALHYSQERLTQQAAALNAALEKAAALEEEIAALKAQLKAQQDGTSSSSSSSQQDPPDDKKKDDDDDDDDDKQLDSKPSAKPFPKREN